MNQLLFYSYLPILFRGCQIKQPITSIWINTIGGSLLPTETIYDTAYSSGAMVSFFRMKNQKMKVAAVFLAITLLSAGVISDDSDDEEEEESAHTPYYYMCLNFCYRTVSAVGYGVIYGCVVFSVSTAVHGCALFPVILYGGIENLPGTPYNFLRNTDSECFSSNLNPGISTGTSGHIVGACTEIFLDTVVIRPIAEEVIFRRILQPIIHSICRRLLQYTGYTGAVYTAYCASNVLTSIAFGLSHIASFHPLHFVRAFNHAFTQYYINGRCYRRHGLVAVITSHATNNAIVFFLLYLLSQAPPST